MSRLQSLKRFLYPRPDEAPEPESAPAPAPAPGADRPARAPAGSVTVLAAEPSRGPNELLRRLGRGVLWAVLLVVLIRGVADIVRGSSTSSASNVTQRAAQPTWPDEQATAFAVRFATAYLTFDPANPDFWKQSVEPFLSETVDADTALELPDSGPAQSADQAVAAGAQHLGQDRATMTVAVRVVGRRVGTRYLAVPVARDRFGGLAVYDYPALVAAPARAAGQPSPPPEQPIRQDEQAIEGLVERFLPAYLEGRDLSYFLADDSTNDVRALSAPLRYEDLLGLAEVKGTPSTSRRRTVVASVRARDIATQATLTLRYRLQLVRGDRWVVQRVAG